MSKIYIATDSRPVDMQSYELCCDMIDVVIDVSWIYGWVLQIVYKYNCISYCSGKNNTCMFWLAQSTLISKCYLDQDVVNFWYSK